MNSLFFESNKQVIFLLTGIATAGLLLFLYSRNSSEKETESESKSGAKTNTNAANTSPTPLPLGDGKKATQPAKPQANNTNANTAKPATPSSATASDPLKAVKSDDALQRRGSQGPGELCPGCQKRVYHAEKLLVKGIE
jgi:hypothetical protein